MPRWVSLFRRASGSRALQEAWAEPRASESRSPGRVRASHSIIAESPAPARARAAPVRGTVKVTARVPIWEEKDAQAAPDSPAEAAAAQKLEQ